MHNIVYSPSDFDHYLRNAHVFYTQYETAAGTLLLMATQDGIFKATFMDDATVLPTCKLVDKIAMDRLILVGTDFQIRVWQAALQIPAGSTASYSSLAQTIDRPTAYRAVARALGQNPIAYLVPCHRIIGKKGTMTGYAWGIEKKRALLSAEGACPVTL